MWPLWKGLARSSNAQSGGSPWGLLNGWVIRLEIVALIFFPPSLGMGFCVVLASGRLALFCHQRHCAPTFARGQALVSSGDPGDMVFLLVTFSRLTAVGSRSWGCTYPAEE